MRPNEIRVGATAVALLLVAFCGLEAERLRTGAVCTADGAKPPWVSYRVLPDGFVFPLEDRWTETATDSGPLEQGDPTTVTWGVVPDGTFIPNVFGEPSADSDLRALLDGVYGGEATWFPLLQESFDTWEQLTGIDFVHEPNDDGEGISSLFPGVLGVRPDVRIGGKFIDGDGGSLAFGLFPQIGDIVLDTTDTKYGDTSDDSFNLKQIVMHEIGHAIGIWHVCPANQTKLMEPTFIDSFFGPQIDDWSAGQRGYGDPLEPNDTDLTAVSLGSLDPGATLVERWVSIDDGDDVDFFSFSVAATADVTVSIVPMGQIYPSEGEQGGGGCDGSAPNYDGVQVHNLKFEVRDSGGGLVNSANAGVSGDSEQLVMNLAADTYTVSIQGTVTTDAIQLYGLWITSGGPRISPPSPGIAGVSNTIDLQGAGAGASEFLVLGFGGGEDAIPTCPNLSDVSGIRLLQSDVANGSGEVTYTFTPPAGAAGRTGFFQVVEGGTCEITNLISATF